jgi:iron complex outermembrane receptor protein
VSCRRRIAALARLAPLVLTVFFAPLEALALGVALTHLAALPARAASADEAAGKPLAANDEAAKQAATAESAPTSGPTTAEPAPAERPAAEEAASLPQGTPPDSGKVERVQVEAPYDRLPTHDPTSFSTVLLRQDLENRMLDLDEALRETAGVQVRAFGGLGQFATVSIRGSTAEQVEVYLDGVPLRPALGGGVNLADLPAFLLERVEVYRGFAPAAYGSGSLAGAVSIRTRGPGDGGADFRATYGSFDTWSAAGVGAGKAAGWDLLGGLQVSGSQGDFAYYGTDHPARRDNNDQQTLHILGRARRALGSEAGGPALEVSNTLLVRDQGVPGFQTQPTPDARYELWRDTVQIGAALSSPWGGWSLDPALYVTVEEQRYANPTRSPATDEENRLWTAGLRAPLVLRPGSALRWTVTPEVRREEARRSDFLLDPEERFTARRDTLFVSAGLEWEAAAGRIVLAPSLRWTGIDSRFSGLELGLPAESASWQDSLSGKIGVRWALTGRLALKANAGRFFREPSLTELYGTSGVVQGSAALAPESGEHADAGLSWQWSAPPRSIGRLRDARLEGSAFVTRADDLILFFPTAGGTVKPHNSGRARVHGLELTGAAGVAGGWAFDLAYTYQRAEDASGLFGLEGKLQPGRPVHELHAGARLRRGRWAALYRYSFIGDNYTDRANTARVPDRHLHTVGTSLAVGAGWELELEAENLADQRTGDLAGFPLPGRMITASARFRP